MEPIISLVILNGIYIMFFFSLGVIGGTIIVDQTEFCLDYVLNRRNQENNNRIRDFTKRSYTE